MADAVATARLDGWRRRCPSPIVAARRPIPRTLGEHLGGYLSLGVERFRYLYSLAELEELVADRRAGA
jgi:hypothetical protein